MLRAFSDHATERLRAALPIRLALPALEPVLEQNVDKEVRKDTAAIDCAAQALERGASPASAEVQHLLSEARRIDRAFLAGAARLPLRIEISYERIEPLRRRRLELGLALAGEVLQGWANGLKLRRAMPPDALERRLLEILLLYAEETQALAQGVRLPGLLSPLRDRVARHLRAELAAAARSVSRQFAHGTRGQR